MVMVKQILQTQQVHAKKTAHAIMKNKPVSLKFVLEIIRQIKGKRVDKAIAYLLRVTEMQDHVPLRVYHGKVAHRKGEAKGYVKAGRYPIRAANAIIELLESVKANADFKGLDGENLIITHMFASQGYARIGYQAMGRISGKRRKHKACHIEIVVREAK